MSYCPQHPREGLWGKERGWGVDVASNNDPESTPPSVIEPFKGGREPSKVGGQLYLVICVQAARRLLGLPPATPPLQTSEPAASRPSAPAAQAADTAPTSAPRAEASTGSGPPSTDPRFSQRLGAMEAAVLQMAKKMDWRFEQLSQARQASGSSGHTSGAEHQQQQVVGMLIRFPCLVSGA